METYGILNSRKRAIIALAHSFVFLAIAMVGLPAAPKAGLLFPRIAVSTANVAVVIVYLVVSTVLAVLTCYSRCLREKLYFGLCTSSATIGLLRSLVGDPVPHAGAIARVVFLTAAVLAGFTILSAHSSPRLAEQ